MEHPDGRGKCVGARSYEQGIALFKSFSMVN